MNGSVKVFTILGLIISSSVIAGGCSSSPKNKDTVAPASNTASTQQEQREVPANADLGAGSSGRGR